MGGRGDASCFRIGWRGVSFGYAPYALLLMASAAVLAAPGVIAVRRRSTPGATAFALVMMAACEWKLSHALEMGANALSSQVFWSKAAYLGAVALPPAWLSLALHYTGL